MNSFSRTFFASLCANLLGLGCLVFVLFVGFTGLVTTWALSFSSGGNTAQEIQDNSILKIDLSSLNDIVNEDPWDFFPTNKAGKNLPLSSTIESINKAKNHPNIAAIYLNVEELDAGMASVDALRRALEDFKMSGKLVLAYADNYTQKAYYLASVADKVFLNPEGMVELTGLASGRMMYKDALDKLGVKMEIFRVGTFKSAVEPFSQNRMSEANKQQTQEYLDGLWDGIVQGIAQERLLEKEDIEEFVNTGKAYSSANTFVEAGLVDSLVYRRDLKELFAEQLELKATDLHMVSLYDVAMQEDTEPQVADKSVKILFAEGDITDVLPDYWQANVNTIGYSLVDELRAAEEDEQIGAVVLRVNTPGGSAFLSEQIWQSVKSLRIKKPVVISMGDLAASGGYYISAPANMIIAEEHTLTGSIGIFGMMPDASELTSKLGLYVDVVKTHEFADLEVSRPYRALNPAQRQLIQRQVERGYELFLKRVSEGRNMSRDAVDSVAQGRVWLGKRALELGLVDKLGGLDTAIKEAAKLAKLSDYRTDYGHHSKNFWQDILNSQNPSNEFVARLRRTFLREEERKVLQFLNSCQKYSGIQARLPYDFALY